MHHLFVSYFLSIQQTETYVISSSSVLCYVHQHKHILACPQLEVAVENHPKTNWQPSKDSRHSQIACMVTIVQIMCTQMVLRMHGNLCMILIPPCENNLNLQICYFFLPYVCILSFIMLPCLLLCCTVLIFWLCFYRNQSCSQAINSLKAQSKGWFSFIRFPISLNRSSGFIYKLYQQDSRIILTYVFVEKLSQHGKY